ncbi:hypothetical protein [Phreatobacter sp. AB_2022a]|uniref:hypothetical protein n=1 Tax=Phreatobacter sp. AB_2022a TaxID=3003134 RepID=UPI00056EDDDF|nr:hypothetical protein [Phreatobacter sp. AB_2022a]MCZ0737321.1 hypothetical protein [Phreatobacter sp. AB_2022a]CEJ13398.1 hypothetical protein BN1110_03713 [bacterium YEK0313]
MTSATPASLTVLGRRFVLPRQRWRRRALGWAFVAGGVLSILPVLGPWMFPVGLAILSVDSPFYRRMRRRLAIRIGRRWPKLNAWLKAPA